MKTRYRFLYRVGGIYHWESVLPIAGDSRHDRISCSVNWFWNISVPAGVDISRGHGKDPEPEGEDQI
jgi:hypothetical protein